MLRRSIAFCRRRSGIYLNLPLLDTSNGIRSQQKVFYYSISKRRHVTSLQLAFNAQKHDTKQYIVEDVPLMQDCNSFTYRTHTCGELRTFHIGQKVSICGWVQYVRLSKFIILRDSYGITQCVVDDISENISGIPLETVVKINGTVSSRPKDMNNNDMPTGQVEVIVESLEVLNIAEKVPFNLRKYQKPKEQLRLQYRYVDLRFPEMQQNLRLRSSVIHNMRKFLLERYGFIEVETPTMFCRTPGGAREFVVPTKHPNLFYSLVQSPQQFKQMLMSGGIDRYFQIARCYRDETTRPDRQPEFTQLDIELSFTSMNDVMTMIEELLFKTFVKELPKPPFRKITYKYALENFGSDKPNITFDLKLSNITKLFSEKDKNFGAFAIAYTSKLGKFTTKYKEKVNELRKKYNTEIILNENVEKELGKGISDNIKNIFDTNSVIIAKGNAENTCLCLGEVREMLAGLLKSSNFLSFKEDIEPLWLIDFPLFERGDEGLKPCHHPFTAPHPEDMHLLDTEPLKVRSLAYDIIINGYEIGGGSVRIHNVDLQEKILKMLNIDPGKLSHFLNALRCGCPPHAGIALGLDRLMAVICDTESIRDVIAFPKSHEGKDPLSGAPNVISEDDKQYYHLSKIK